MCGGGIDRQTHTGQMVSKQGDSRLLHSRHRHRHDCLREGVIKSHVCALGAPACSCQNHAAPTELALQPQRQA
jgi:hypothetical protein